MRGWTGSLETGIYFFFILFAILLPWSIKGARYAWMAAFVLWLLQVVFGCKPVGEQPLVLPLLAYLVMSGISTAFSPDPYLSWPHMRLVCWTVMVGILFAQNLHRLSQIRTLVVLLLLSATAVAGFTAWQYTHGLGLQIVEWTPDAPLIRAGLRGDDILVSANGRSLRSQQDLRRVVQGLSPDSTVRIRYLRGLPLRKKETFLRAGQLAEAAEPVPNNTFKLGKPMRAEGTLKHPMVLAEVMMPMACLAWALMLGAWSKRTAQVVFALIFLALTATVFLTQARAALTGLLMGCFIAAAIMASPRIKVRLIAALLLIAVGGGLWVHHTRGLKWIDLSDPGTRYRLVMWQDGLRLAASHPLTGVGMETIQNHWPEWRLRGFSEYKKFWHFHSDIIQIAAERGVLTLAAWLWFVVGYVVYLARLLRSMRAQSQLFAWALTTGILTGFVGFLFVSLVQYTLGDDSMLMLLLFCYGAAAAMERILREPGKLDVT